MLVDRISSFLQHTALYQGADSVNAEDPPAMILASDGGSDEGSFVNNADGSVAVWVLGDRADDEIHIRQTLLQPGESAQGDAVAVDTNRDGLLNEGDLVVKTPNHSHYEVVTQCKDGGTEVVVQNTTSGVDLVEAAGAFGLAELKDMLGGNQRYGKMSLDYFLNDLMWRQLPEAGQIETLSTNSSKPQTI